jgi:nuclear polyadenylated RNA-binding protein 3
MFLHPRMPKDQVIQRQAVEGVHGVVDLDLRAQHMGKIPLQAFDRSAGASNIRFDQYVDLDPSIAAEVILRTKATSAPSYGSQQYASMPTGTYGNPYGGQGQPPAANSYNGMPAYPPQQQAPSHQAADIASLIGKVDQRTLQQLLASYQGGAQPAMPHAVPAHGTSAPMPQHDIQALLNSIGQQPTQTPQQAPVSGQYGAPYGAQAAPYQQPPAHGDSAAQVQNIMAQLARYRQ